MAADIPRRRELTLDEYRAGVLARDMAVLPRALTLVESSHPAHQLLAEQLVADLLPWRGRAIRVGITGVPGAGKSTLIESLGLRITGAGQRVAVLAVDPSSRLSGGSVLGDKTRMARLSAESNSFIRPSPSAGTLGGVARKTRESMLICEAAGYDVVLIETVGVGQSEAMVAEMTDCFLALMLPGGGDELQAVKRGLLELVDVIAVNKADGESLRAAEFAAKQLGQVLTALSAPGAVVPPVLTCSALHDCGVDVLWEAMERCHAARKASGELDARRRRQDVQWLWRMVDDRLRQALQDHPRVASLREELERDVREGVVAPEVAARRVLTAFGIVDHLGSSTRSDRGNEA